MHMSLFNYLPINAFRLIYGVSIICCQEIGKHIYICNYELSCFFERHPFLWGRYIEYIG